jgi:hypothetical protein
VEVHELVVRDPRAVEEEPLRRPEPVPVEDNGIAERRHSPA